MKTQNADFNPDVSRRSALLAGARALIAAAIFPLPASSNVNAAAAANSPPKHGLYPDPHGANDMNTRSNINTPNELLDSVAVSDIILRERLARESHDWTAEAACFHPDATVEVSWFKGSGAEFVDTAKKNDASKGNPATDTVNFDSMSPAVVTVKNNRALADTACAVHTFSWLDGIEVSTTSYTRLLWRAQKLKGQWLIAGLRGIYLRDTLVPRNPNQVLKLDENRLSQFRPSYRYLSYVLTAGGRPAHDDLPGIDRPETVTALRAGEREWLEQG